MTIGITKEHSTQTSKSLPSSTSPSLQTEDSKMCKDQGMADVRILTERETKEDTLVITYLKLEIGTE